MSTMVPVSRRSHSPVAVYLVGLAEGSRRTVLVRLRSAIAVMSDRQTADVSQDEALSFPWTSLQPDSARVLRAAVAARFEWAHANWTLSAVRGVLRNADALTPQLARALEQVKGSRIPEGRHIPWADKRRLFRTVSKDRHSTSRTRDAALLAVGFTCGLRVSELVALDLSDYNPETGAMAVRHAKGNRQRTVYLANGQQDAVADWSAVRGGEPGAMFYRIRKGGAIIRERLSPSGVEDVLRRRCEQAGIAPFAAHDLRRTFIGDLLSEGEDLSTVQQLAGHASVTTTARYDRRPEERKREAQARLTIPYKRAQ